MSVRLRLTRMGRKKRPFYRIIAVDSRRKRDGAYIERIGYYHPLDNPPGVAIDADKALKWLRDGAQPSETVRSLLKKEGVWFRFRLERRGLTESQISQMMADWFKANKKPIETPIKKAKVSKPIPEVTVSVSEITTESVEPEQVSKQEASPAEITESEPTVVKQEVDPVEAEVKSESPAENG